MEIAYKNEETREVVKVNSEITPRAKFPASKYTKLYEMASVDAKDIAEIHKEKCPRSTPNKVQLSVDGVSESKSTSVSLDVYSFKYLNCRAIYPHRIVRPLNKYAMDNKKELEKVLSNLHDCDYEIDCMIADNLKRSTVRCALNHASYFPCEYCDCRGILRKNKEKTSDEIDDDASQKAQREFIISRIVYSLDNDPEQVHFYQNVLNEFDASKKKKTEIKLLGLQ